MSLSKLTICPYFCLSPCIIVQVNTPYSNLTRFAFAYIPFFERLYRWRLFYQFDSSSLAKGMGKWSSALREVHTNKLVNYLKAKAPEIYWEVLIPKYREYLFFTLFSLRHLFTIFSNFVSTTLQTSGLQRQLARISTSPERSTHLHPNSLRYPRRSSNIRRSRPRVRRDSLGHRI